MDAVPSGPAPDGDNPVTRPRFGGVRTRGEHAQRPAVDQRVGDVPLVVDDRSVHSGEAQLVAVVAYSRHDAVTYAAGVQHARGQVTVGRLGRPETEHVRAGDGTGRHPHHVPDHPADAGVGAAERFERRWMVVGLDLEGQVEVIVEGHDACVVVERRAEPGGIDLLGDRPEGTEQSFVVGDRHRAIGPRVLQADTSPERLVHAVLGPGLGQCLELGVGRVTFLLPVVITDGPHLGQVEREQTLPAETLEIGVRQTGQRDGLDARLPRGRGIEVGLDASEGVDFDRLVGQQPPADGVYVSLIEVADQLVTTGRRSPHRGQAEGGCGPFQLPRLGIGHARTRRDLHRRVERGRR